MEEHHVLWVLSLRTSELMHKINNTLLTTLHVDLCYLLASNHVKPWLLFEKFTTSQVLMQDRGYVPLLKKENARYVLAFPHVLAVHNYPTHTLSYGNQWHRKAKRQETILSDNGHSGDDMYFPRVVMAAEPVVA